MPLDLYIHGPGYGETIILHWHGDGADGCAVVDACLPRNGDGFALHMLRKLDVPKLDLLAATHPHLDHTKFIHRIVSEFSDRLDAVWWWGGADREFYLAYFRMLAATQKKRKQRDRADSIQSFLLECALRRKSGRLPLFETSCEVSGILAQPVQEEPLMEIFAISPWANPLAVFIRSLAEAQLAQRDLQSEINRVSLGFIVNYGKAQVLLGGDMDCHNWTELRARWDTSRADALHAGRRFPEIRPDVVKVSHHGSETSCLPDMWGCDGFLVPPGRPPIAVITPWNHAPEERKLPRADVIDRIRRSGSRVFVTATPRTRSEAVRSRMKFPCLHLRLSAEGVVDVIERGESEELAPLIQS